MIAGFRAQNHPHQVARDGAVDHVDDRATPADAFATWSARFGGFTLDVAAAEHNTKCQAYFDRNDDGLMRDWSGRVWCNPPFSDIPAWIRKAHGEVDLGRVDLVVMLIPANRTDQAWWHELVEPYRLAGDLRVEFLRGRLRFEYPPGVDAPKHNRPLFGCCLLIWDQRLEVAQTRQPPVVHADDSEATA